MHRFAPTAGTCAQPVLWESCRWMYAAGEHETRLTAHPSHAGLSSPPVRPVGQR